MRAWGKWNIDASRHGIEILPPVDYLRMSYYEKWLARTTELLVKRGMVTREEMETGKPAPGSQKATPTLTAPRCPASRPIAAISGGRRRMRKLASRRAAGPRPKYQSVGHTRLPRYARGKTGTSRATRESSFSPIPTRIFWARSRSTCTRFVFRRGSCGARGFGA